MTSDHVISLYCGADGMGEGMRQAGIQVTLAIDVEEDCLRTVKLNNPDCEVICGKVRDYIESLPKARIVVGGPPCPEFSRAKANRTFDMCEVNNFWNAVDHCKPDYFLMENVQDIGKVHKWVSVREALGIDGIIEDRKQNYGYKASDYMRRQYDPNNPMVTICTDSRLWISSAGFKRMNREMISRSIDEPIDTIVIGNEFQFTNYPVKSIKKIRNRNPTIFKKHPPTHLDEPSMTIAAKDRAQSEMLTDGIYCRKLTNEELAILQGFPREFKFYGNKRSVRRQIGNAVPPPVSKAFFSQITKEVVT